MFFYPKDIGDSMSLCPNASAWNRTRVTSMATMYSTTRPLMLMCRGKPESCRDVLQASEQGRAGRAARAGPSCLRVALATRISFAPPEGPGQHWGGGPPGKFSGCCHPLSASPARRGWAPIPGGCRRIGGRPTPRRPLSRGVGGLRRRWHGVARGPEAREAGGAASARADWLSESAIV